MKRLITFIVIGAAAATMLAAGVALASSGAKKPATINIVMHDPGCHWYQVGAKFTKSMTVNGPTTFRNFDEKALIFKGAGFTEQVAVGKTITISKPGTYHITMVKQAPDDNHLLLIVK